MSLLPVFCCVCQGLIFDESVPPDRTLEPDHEKPKVSLIEDPKQSQVSWLTGSLNKEVVTHYGGEGYISWD